MIRWKPTTLLKSLAAVAAFAVFVCSSSAMAAEPLKVKLGAHIESSGGQSSGQLYEMTKGMIEAMKKEYGLDIEWIKYSTYEDVESAFLKKEVDIALLWPMQAAMIEEKGGSTLPWVTYQIRKKDKNAYCLWQRKSLKGSKPQDAIGRRLTRNSYDLDTLLILREYFFTNGMDQPLWKIFDSFVKTPSANSAFMAISMGDADYFWASQDSETSLDLIAPGVSDKTNHLMCNSGENARGNLVLNKKTLDRERIQRLEEICDSFIADFNENAKKYPALKAMKAYMKLARASIAASDQNEFDYDKKLYAKARARGWIDEAEIINDFMDKAPGGKPVKIKLDYAQCRKICAKEKNIMNCINRCME